MNLAQKIQKHRKKRGLTQEELAEALDVSHQSISKWESGQTMPGLDKVLLLSEFFQVSTDYLLKGEVYANAVVEPPATPIPSQQPQPLPVPSQPPPEVRRSSVFRYLGVCVTAAGCGGLLLLWVLSLLNPPYTLGKTLGPIDMFSFYIRYHEMETHLKLAGVTALLGAGLIALDRLWRARR